MMVTQAVLTMVLLGNAAAVWAVPFFALHGGMRAGQAQ